MNFTKTLMETITSLNMNNKTTLREELERIKTKCPTCPMPHNLSSMDIDRIMALIDTAVQKAVPKKLKRMSIEREYEDYMDGFNDSLDEFQSNWEKVKKGNL